MSVKCDKVREVREKARVLRQRVITAGRWAAENIRQFAAENPIATMCLCVILAACSVPVLFFLAFAVVSTFLTFCGFLFIEGKDQT